jgi:SET domain-containing protein
MSFLFPDKILQPAGLSVRPSPIHGLGVFTSLPLKKGALIERAPLILLETADKDYLRNTMLYHFYFVVNNQKNPAALGLGFSSLYNHSPHANSIYKISVKRQSLDIIAVRSIAAGEEITLNYNGRPDDESPVYFPNEPV